MGHTMNITIESITNGAVSAERPVAMVPGLGRVLMEPDSSGAMRVSDGMTAIVDTYTVRCGADVTTHYTVSWVEVDNA